MVPSTDIHFHQVHLRRGKHTVFQNLNLHLSEPRIGLLGDNGVGKSSLFRLICGLEEPVAGTVQACGETIGPRTIGWVGMMFQNPDEQIIFPTVVEELAFSLTAQSCSRQQAQQQVRDFLQQHGLSDWATRAISTLSQGQRQRVCWLAMLIAQPRILLLDEPFASLDLPGQLRLQQEIKQAKQQVLVSTHQLDHIRHFERVLWLDNGQVRADGPGTEVCAAYEAHVHKQLQQPTPA